MTRGVEISREYDWIIDRLNEVKQSFHLALTASRRASAAARRLPADDHVERIQAVGAGQADADGRPNRWRGRDARCRSGDRDVRSHRYA